MEIDPDISGWILEFLLRQSVIDDPTAELALSLLPFSDADLRLKKTILLRFVQSEFDTASLSEETLDVLEAIEEVDRLDGGLPVSDAMREAYCSVAVDCTVRFLYERLDEGGVCFRAVQRIRVRVGRMDKSATKSGLLSPELCRWSLRVETAIHDGSERENLLAMNTRGDVLRSVSTPVFECVRI